MAGLIAFLLYLYSCNLVCLASTTLFENSILHPKAELRRLNSCTEKNNNHAHQYERGLERPLIPFCSIIKRRPLQGEWCDCMEDNPQLD